MHCGSGELRKQRPSLGNAKTSLQAAKKRAASTMALKALPAFACTGALKVASRLSKAAESAQNAKIRARPTGLPLGKNRLSLNTKALSPFPWRCQSLRSPLLLGKEKLPLPRRRRPARLHLRRCLLPRLRRRRLLRYNSRLRLLLYLHSLRLLRSLRRLLKMNGNPGRLLRRKKPRRKSAPSTSGSRISEVSFFSWLRTKRFEKKRSFEKAFFAAENAMARGVCCGGGKGGIHHKWKLFARRQKGAV